MSTALHRTLRSLRLASLGGLLDEGFFMIETSTLPVPPERIRTGIDGLSTVMKARAADHTHRSHQLKVLDGEGIVGKRGSR